VRSLPCGVTVQTLLRRLADCVPTAMQTGLAPGQVTAKESAEAEAFKDGLARLAAHPVIIAYSFIVFAKHMIKNRYLTAPLPFLVRFWCFAYAPRISRIYAEKLLLSSSAICRYSSKSSGESRILIITDVLIG
jgi:hypothetical protein